MSCTRDNHFEIEVLGSARSSACRQGPRLLWFLDAGDDETVGTLNWPASSPQRGFLLWRLSDAGRRIRGAVSQAAGIPLHNNGSHRARSPPRWHRDFLRMSPQSEIACSIGSDTAGAIEQSATRFDSVSP